MTVEQLINKLKELPADVVVRFPDGDFKGSTSVINHVLYQKDPTWGSPGNTVVLSDSEIY